MNSEINNFFLKKGNFLLFKIILWGGFGFLFISFSFLIPTNSGSTIKEILVFLCLALVVNIHTSYLYSIISKRSNLGYIGSLLASILFCALFEIVIFYENFDIIYYDFLNKSRLFYVAFGYIFIRDFAIFIFFLWVEYFNRVIILYNKKEKIHQEEILLLIEKQEFEKKFSRKKILPHYFFNILENIYARSLDSINDLELLDKLKFVLYYFLVDAEKEKVELDKELVFYKYYIDLENFRHNKKIAVDFKILGQPEEYTIIPLLFESILGNAMKYTEHDGSGWVDVTIDASHFPVLNFYCRNNYAHHHSNIISSENGLKLFKQRLELCYKDNYALKIEQNVDYYEVTMSITVI